MDRRKLLKAVTDAGWSVEKSRGGHLKITAPTGEMIFTSSTPSDWRGTKNLASQLRKLGLNV